MKNFVYVIGICVFVLGMSACKSKGSTKLETSESGDNSKNSLDWTGVYTGILPCADCAGIFTQITLQTDNTYQLQINYIGKEESVETIEGTFQWNSAGSIITLSGLKEKSMPSAYKVGEGKLIQLNMEGKVITGELASNYELTKINENLVEKKWVLFELNGVDLSTKDPKPAIEAFITFQIDRNRVHGNSGCNNFTGTYQLGAGNELHFSGMASTRKMCIDMSIENQINQLYQTVDSYSLQDNILSLNHGDTPLARFVLEE